MTYPPLLQLNFKEEYQTAWHTQYCQQPIFTFDEIRVWFRKEDFNHAFYESVKAKNDTFSKRRAERMHWIKVALQDPKSERFAGWDKVKKRYDHSRRVAIVMQDYIVVISLLQNKNSEARFITAYVGDRTGKNGKPATIDLIRSGPLWQAMEIKKPLIRQAGSAAEAFLGSTTTGGEHG